MEQVEESVHTSQQIKLTFQKRKHSANNWVRKKDIYIYIKYKEKNTTMCRGPTFHHGMFQDLKNI